MGDRFMLYRRTTPLMKMINFASGISSTLALQILVASSSYPFSYVTSDAAFPPAAILVTPVLSQDHLSFFDSSMTIW